MEPQLPLLAVEEHAPYGDTLGPGFQLRCRPGGLRDWDRQSGLRHPRRPVSDWDRQSGLQHPRRPRCLCVTDTRVPRVPRAGGMFVLVEMVDTVRIPPWQFERKLNDSIAEELNKKLANKVLTGSMGSLAGLGRRGPSAAYLPAFGLSVPSLGLGQVALLGFFTCAWDRGNPYPTRMLEGIKRKTGLEKKAVVELPSWLSGNEPD